MAVTFVNKAESTDQLVSSRLVSKPSGVTTDDVGVFFLTRWDSGGSFPTVTAPSGAVLRNTIATGAIETRVYVDYVQSEVNWSFTWTGARWSSLSVVFFRGVDLTLDLTTVPFNSATGTSTAITTTSVTTSTGAALAWNVNTQDYAAATTHVHPSGYTEAYDFDAYDTAYKIATGSSESAASATNSSSQIWIAALVALAPAGAGGAVSLDAKGSASAAASASGVVDRPVAANASAGAESSGGLAAARPVAGQGTSAAATTAGASVSRPIAATGTAAAAISGQPDFERGLRSNSNSAAAAGGTMLVARPLGGGGSAAAGAAASLVGGIVELAAAGGAAAAVTALASFVRGLDSSANAAGDSTGLLGSNRGVAGYAGSSSEASASLELVKAWYRLVVPQIVEYFTIRGSLRTSMVREVTVFGDENGLFTSELGAIPEGGDEYGAIPFGTKYIWYGGHLNLTDDPDIRDLWLAHGFEVELVQM